MSNRQEYESIVRSMIEHENELMNHRVTWLSAIHGLLFAALGFAWGKDGADSLVIVLGVLGIIVSLSFFTVLRSASKAVSALAEWWEKNEKPEGYGGPGVIGWRTTEQWQKFLYPWNMLPAAFILAWLSVLAIHFG